MVQGCVLESLDSAGGRCASRDLQSRGLAHGMVVGGQKKEAAGASIYRVAGRGIAIGGFSQETMIVRQI